MLGAWAKAGFKPGSSARSAIRAVERIPANGRGAERRTGRCFEFFCILEELKTKKMIGDGPFNQAKNLFVPSVRIAFVINHKIQFYIER